MQLRKSIIASAPASPRLPSGSAAAAATCQAAHLGYVGVAWGPPTACAIGSHSMWGKKGGDRGTQGGWTVAMWSCQLQKTPRRKGVRWQTPDLSCHHPYAIAPLVRAFVLPVDPGTPLLWMLSLVRPGTQEREGGGVVAVPRGAAGLLSCVTHNFPPLSSWGFQGCKGMFIIANNSAVVVEGNILVHSPSGLAEVICVYMYALCMCV